MPTLKDSIEDIAFGIFHHDSFDAAVKLHVEKLAAWRCGLGGFNKVISSHARNYIIHSVIYLHFQTSADDMDKGATFERLLKFCGERGYCGPRVLRTVLMLASNSGHLTVERGRYDRRLKIFHPTEKLLEKAGQFLGHSLDCLDSLVDDISLGAQTGAREKMMRQVMATAGRRYFEEGVPVSEYYDDLYALLRLDGGFATVMSMTDAQLHDRPLPGYKEIAAKFRFSASQSRKILKLAEELDLVTFSRDGRVADASALARTFKWAIARELALYAKYTFDLGAHFASTRQERRGVSTFDGAQAPYRAAAAGMGW